MKLVNGNKLIEYSIGLEVNNGSKLTFATDL